MSGGFSIPDGNYAVVHSAPTVTASGRQGWQLGVASPPIGFSLKAHVYARCLDLTP